MNFWDRLKEKDTPIIALAPMAGVTDAAFRQMCKDFGADLVYSEMVSTEGLQYAPDKALERAYFEEKERPIIVQLMGSDPAKFAEAARRLEEMGVDGIDINFGCPAKKITKSCSGVQLMEDLDKAHAILKATIEATSLPVSCKIRKSKWSDKEKRFVTGLEFVEKMKDLDIKALMVHGRDYSQVHTGEVDYDAIKEIKKKFNGVVLANGGITTPQEAAHMLDVTGADGVGVARGAQGKPYIFKHIKEYFETGSYEPVNTKLIRELMMKHLELSYEHKEGRGLLEMRKHLAWYMKGLEGASQVRRQIMQSQDLDELKAILKAL
jgi:tRNA-dihydrouridine synthase B